MRDRTAKQPDAAGARIGSSLLERAYSHGKDRMLAGMSPLRVGRRGT